MLAAVDIDLRRIHCRTEDGRDICTNVDFDRAVPLLLPLANEGVTLLVECASPHMYGPQQILKKKLSWMIYNSVITDRLHTLFDDILVSPSSSWTYGYNVKVRHVMADCKARNKDLRECEAMMWFYKKDPSKWTTLDQYLSHL